jgi:hypothetical protein
MRVRTLRGHGNAYGPVYEPAESGGMQLREGDIYSKRAKDVYDHPAPASLIEDGVVEALRPLDHDGDNLDGGSLAGEESTAATGARHRMPRAKPNEA